MTVCNMTVDCDKGGIIKTYLENFYSVCKLPKPTTTTTKLSLLNYRVTSTLGMVLLSLTLPCHNYKRIVDVYILCKLLRFVVRKRHPYSSPSIDPCIYFFPLDFYLPSPFFSLFPLFQFPDQMKTCVHIKRVFCLSKTNFKHKTVDTENRPNKSKNLPYCPVCQVNRQH